MYRPELTNDLLARFQNRYDKGQGFWKWLGDRPMHPDEMFAYLRRQPFEPSRIHLTDETIYEVRHPDQCIVTRTAIHVALPTANHSYARGLSAYALVHVNRLEPMAVEQAQ